MTETKLRRVRLRFAKTPIVRFLNLDAFSETESKLILAADGPQPQVHQSLEGFTVFLFVPWFNDDVRQQTELAHLADWCRIAQREILSIKDSAIFDPSFD